MRAVVGLAAGKLEDQRLALDVCVQVDVGGEAALGAAERLACLPSFAPAGETWARTTVLSNMWTK